MVKVKTKRKRKATKGRRRKVATPVSRRDLKRVNTIAAAFTQADTQNGRKPAPVIDRGGSAWFRMRRHRKPWWIGAAVAVTGETAYAAREWGHAPAATSSLTTASVMLLAILIGVGVCRGRGTGLLTRYVAGAVFGVWWLSHVAATGIGYSTGAELVTAVTVLGSRWWRRPGVYLPDPSVDEVATGQTIPELFDAHLANESGILRGAKLRAPERLQYSMAYILELVPAKHTLTRVLANLELIAGGLRTPQELLVVERITAPDGGKADPNLLKLQVITESPIAERVFYKGVEYRGGRIHVGTWADGVGTASIRLYTDQSIWGGFLLGSTGAGKSRAMECIAVSVRSVPHTVLWVADGQSGSSSTSLYKGADWAVGRHDADSMLAALEDIIAIRGEYQTHVLDRDYFVPTADMVGLVVFVDECQAIFRPDVAKRWGEVQRMGRKVGVTIWAATQTSGQDCFGGDEALRSNLYAGNLIVMRTMSKVSTSLLPGETVDAAALPELPGYAYVLGVGSRNAPMRFWYLPSDNDKAADPTITVPTVTDWINQTPGWPLDPVSATHAGDAYRNRHSIAAAAKAASVARIEAAHAGRVMVDPRRKQTRAAIELESATVSSLGLTFPEFVPPAYLRDAPPVPVPAGLSEPQAKVYTAIARGAATNPQVQEITQLKERRVRDLLTELAAEGHVASPSRGRYVLAGSDEATG